MTFVAKWTQAATQREPLYTLYAYKNLPKKDLYTIPKFNKNYAIRLINTYFEVIIGNMISCIYNKNPTKAKCFL